MFRDYLLLMVSGHILGDFYIQTEKMAYRKTEDKKNLFLHGLLYWLSMLIVSLPVISLPVFLYSTAAAVLHFAIDYIKYMYISAKKKRQYFST